MKKQQILEETILAKEMHIELLESTIIDLKNVLYSVTKSNDSDFINKICTDTLKEFYDGSVLLNKHYFSYFDKKS